MHRSEERKEGESGKRGRKRHSGAAQKGRKEEAAAEIFTRHEAGLSKEEEDEGRQEERDSPASSL